MLDVNCPCGSAKKFVVCHGAPAPISLIDYDQPGRDGVDLPEADIVVAKPAVTRKLDLAAGQRPREGFEGVDLWPESNHVVDLTRYPWPFEDSSVLELHSSHYAEHIEMMYVDATGERVRGWKDGKEALFAFFDECFRILVPGGIMTVIVPCGRNDRGFQDPTHRRFFVAPSFLYFNAEWRKINQLDHYQVICDFGVSVVPIVPVEMTVVHSEAAARRMTHEWNTISDWQATLISKKPAT